MTGSTSSSVFLAFRPDREFRSESAFCSAESDESYLSLRRRKPLCFGWSWTLMDELLNCSFCVSETWMKTMRRRGWWWQSGIAIGLPGRSCLNEFENINVLLCFCLWHPGTVSRKSKWCWVTSSVPGQRKWSDQLILIHGEFIIIYHNIHKFRNSLSVVFKRLTLPTGAVISWAVWVLVSALSSHHPR